MKVKCIKPEGSMGDLELGKIYQVKSESNSDYLLYGITCSWRKDRFEIISLQVRCDCDFGLLIYGRIYDVDLPHFSNAHVVLKGNTLFYPRNIFSIIFNDEEKEEMLVKAENLPEWKLWAQAGLQKGECVCRIPRELCDFHRT